MYDEHSSLSHSPIYIYGNLLFIDVILFAAYARVYITHTTPTLMICYRGDLLYDPGGFSNRYFKPGSQGTIYQGTPINSPKFVILSNEYYRSR